MVEQYIINQSHFMEGKVSTIIMNHHNDYYNNKIESKNYAMDKDLIQAPSTHSKPVVETVQHLNIP